MERRDILAGPGGDENTYHGERLGLPPEGAGSMASLGRRVPALLIDWFACMAISWWLFSGDEWATLAVFAVENLVLVATLGSTLGHRLLGIGVRPLTGRRVVGVPAALVRAVLLCLVIPAVVWDADGRGLHDRVAGTVLVRR
ncbi:MAG: RDD family protein [Cellulomonadaceae bacterium]